MVHSRGSSGSSSSSSSSSDSDNNDAAPTHWWQRVRGTKRKSRQAGSNAAACSSAAKVVILSAVQRVLPSSTMSNNHHHSNAERTPLLSTGTAGHDGSPKTAGPSNPKVRSTIWGLMTLLFVIALVLFLKFEKVFGDTLRPYLGTLPSDPYLAALEILNKAPVIVRFCSFFTVR